MPTTAEIYAALGYSPTGMPIPLPNPQDPMSQVPAWMKWGGAPDIPKVIGPSPWSMIPQGNNPPLDLSGMFQNDYAKYAGAAPIDAGSNVALNPQPPSNELFGQHLLRTAISSSPILAGLAGGVKAFRGIENYLFPGPEAQAQTPGLPPLNFGDYSIAGSPDAGVAGVDPTVAASIPFDIESMPRPPLLDAPPDFDMENLQGATRSNILGSLAAGAAQVDPTEAGSFARALASAGGAGSLAAGESKRDAAEIEYKNALNAYNVSMKNKELEYEYEGKKWEMTLPKMDATDDSVVVQEFKDGNYQVRVIPTGGLLQNADEYKKLGEAIGADGPQAEALETQFVIQSTKNDPAAMQTSLTRLAIERTVRNGAGPVVFGDAYTEAENIVRPQVLQTVGITSNPEEFNKALARGIAAQLMSNPDIMADDSWLIESARFGTTAARVLTHGN